MKNLIKTKTQSQAGFTVAELLIAVAVFSVVLLLCTSALLQIGRVYYKGIISANTQEVARGIMDDISRAIQFNGGTISGPTGGPNEYRFCIGERRYSYLLGRQLEDSAAGAPSRQRKNVMVVDKTAASCASSQNLDGNPAPNTLNAGSRELLTPHMRIVRLTVAPAGGATNAYQINLRVVYGDDDLLCSPSAPGNECSSNAVSTNLDNPDLTCKSVRAGTQFCAATELQTVVQKRVQ